MLLSSRVQDAESPRLILVSNRLPISIDTSGAEPRVLPGAGGLVTGLAGPHERRRAIWVGWPGDLSAFEGASRRAIDDRLHAMRAVPVEIDAKEADRFYEGFSNGVLWPLFHYLVDRVPLAPKGWDEYVRVNQRFADVIAATAQPGDTIWIHDYQLMLVPAMLRERLPDARIGFFLHIPFPSSEVFRMLPWREQLLEGLLGADLIGFHTFAYLGHFATSLLRILGIEPEVDRVHHGGRAIRLGVFPMGIDGEHFAKLGSDPEVVSLTRQIREASTGMKMLLGVDRLDYTKGLLRRMLAIERLLELEPALRGKLKFVQLCVPSREKVDHYRSFRRELEELVGRINGKYATLHGAPIHYLYRSIPQEQLCAMYSATDVMVVTPLRDGMNLVAKEFAATRVDGDGVLVLSEFAGASSELGEAVITNPYDIDATADALRRALMMPEAERRSRMAVLHARVRSRSVHEWASSFLSTLDGDTAYQHAIDVTVTPSAATAAVATLAAAKDLVLLLDYDGTLVGFTARPEMAAPDEELRELLRDLAALPATSVQIVSGRPREALQQWLGDLPLVLHAEHGLWWRDPSGLWRCRVPLRDEWKPRVRPVLEEYVMRTPGSLLEEKSASFSWHYRAADPELGVMQARELRLHLVQLLAQQPLEILTGDKVIEVRQQDARKGLGARAAVAEAPLGARVAAFGDDRTDEDLFAALPPSGMSFHVGERATCATHRIAGPEALRALLKELLRSRKSRFS